MFILTFIVQKSFISLSQADGPISLIARIKRIQLDEFETWSVGCQKNIQVINIQDFHSHVSSLFYFYLDSFVFATPRNICLLNCLQLSLRLSRLHKEKQHYKAIYNEWHFYMKLYFICQKCIKQHIHWHYRLSHKVDKWVIK